VPLVTAEMARATGHVLIKLPQAALGNTVIGRITGKAMKETADVFERLGRFLEDGVIDKAEGTQTAKEIDEAIEQLLTLKLQVQADAEREASR
jgi:hypothetical protein